MSCHVMSCHVMSCHVMSCHVMSCHVMSSHVMPYHIISPLNLLHLIFFLIFELKHFLESNMNLQFSPLFVCFHEIMGFDYC